MIPVAVSKNGLCTAMFALLGLYASTQPASNKPVQGATQPPAPHVSGTNIYQPAGYSGTLPVNYVRTWEALGPYADEASFSAAAAATDGYKNVKEATQYLDGLGRPLQTVSRQASPGTSPQDLVQPVVYDEFGRERYRFMPYVSPSSNGLLKMDPFAEQKTFLQGQFLGEQVFYGKTNFEASPLNRPEKTFAPGNSWAGSEGGANEHAVRVKYLVNTAPDDVRVWEITYTALAYSQSDNNANLPTSNSAYAPGELSKTVTLDEQGGVVVEYKNKDGLLILKKVLLDGSSPQVDYSGYDGYACTYYVYDDLNRLRCVMQPNLVKELATLGWTVGFLQASFGCFRYEYDARGRMIAKKTPGVQWTYMIYDQRDRLVFVKAPRYPQGGWRATLYDELNRPVVTGFIDYHGSAAQLVQRVNGVNTNHTAPLTITGNKAEGGTFSTTVNVNGNPLGNNYFYGFTITYYDNYTWTNAAYTTQHNGKLTAGANLHAVATPSQASTQTLGLITGTRTIVIDNAYGYFIPTSPWLSSVNFYDDRNRLIQTRSVNYKGGTDVTTNLYDFNGKVLTTYAVHQNPAASVDMGILTNMEFDHAGRLLKTQKSIFNQSGDASPALATTVSELAYDPQGQLLTKKLGQQRDVNGNYTASPVETLDHSYNLRGWLRGINWDYANNSGLTANNRWFGMELNYDWGFGNNQFGGNIAGTKWRSKGDGELRSYGFSYDNANRILGADFGQFDGTGYDDNTNNINFDMQMGGDGTHQTSYDANGNILQMQHWGLDGIASRQIDNLSYTYRRWNFLTRVTDNAAVGTNNLGDFKRGAYLPNGVKAADWGFDDYYYDDNGNMTLDFNKGLLDYTNPMWGIEHGIRYNHMNLPQRIRKFREDNTSPSLNGTIRFVYDAEGNKLEKVVDEEPSAANNNQRKITTTTYLGGFTYENNRLQFLPHEEGRIRPLPTTPLTWAADYMVKDHLGNVRVVLTDERKQQTYPTATLEGVVSDNMSAIHVEKDYFQINSGNVVAKSEALDIPDYPNNNGNPPHNANPNGDATANSAKLYRLNANNASAKMGLGTVLEVMAGDEVKIFGKSYWKTAVGGVSGVPEPIGALELLNAFVDGSAAAASKGVTGSALNGIPGIPLALGQLFGSQQQTSTQPKAYINWILFDRQFQPVMEGTNSSFSPVGAEGVLTTHKQSNGDFLTTGEIARSGYLYVYCSNESRVDVFFDNLQVVHNRGPLLEETHYYPFGLTMQGISSRAAMSLDNKKDYNANELQSKEFSDGSGLDVYDFNARTYDQQLGRFIQVDPMTDEGGQESWSPYHFGYNNPVTFSDPDGKIPIIPIIVIGARLAYQGYRVYRAYQAVKTAQAAISYVDGKMRAQEAEKKLQNESNVLSKATEQKKEASVEKPKELVIDGAKHPEAAQHGLDAKEGGSQVEGVVDRKGRDDRRRENLKGKETEKGKDRDEFPPAVIKTEGPVSVRSITSGDNRGAGASLGQQLKNVPDNTRVVIRILPPKP